jgi:ribonuclease HII
MEGPIILAGVDEAGYGPLLGPLVVTAVAFEGPATWARASLWEELAASVCRRPQDKKRRMSICDSKKLYKSDEGLARLERSALGATLAGTHAWHTAGELLEALCPGCVTLLSACPWYGDLGRPLPLDNDAASLAVAASALRRDLEARGGRLAGVFCEILPEGAFNELVGRTHNKAAALLGLTFRLIDRVARAWPGRPMVVRADRQGGRTSYGRPLMRSFEDLRLKIDAEDDGHSCYELTDRQTRWEISFDTAGESKHLPIALASIVSKYVRELLMRCFNDYWGRQAPEVRPTAGYYTDGCRFITEIAPHLARLGIAPSRLVRQR